MTASLDTAQELTTAIRAELGADATVHTDYVNRVKYAHDASHYVYMPKAVIEARSAADVAAAFRAGQASGTPVILRSGGTSLCGQGGGEGILVDVRKHFRDVTVLDGGARVRVQPGATVRNVNAHLALYGRRLGPDPASEIAATMGGVMANNSAGMSCGTKFNTYNTLESLTFVLPSGTMINTADPDAEREFAEREPAIVEKLMQLKRRIEGNPQSVAKIRKHFALKNTMGYSVNAFLDFGTPLKIFERLLIGSEGTLAFIAEGVYRTLPLPKVKSTSMAVFRDIEDATRSLPALFDSQAATLELMDSRSIAVGRTFPQVPPEITGFDVNQQAALLIEYHAQDDEELAAYVRAGEDVLRGVELQTAAVFSQDPAPAAKAWSFRKGLYAQVAEKRPAGTTSLFEDVVVPIEDLADTCLNMQALFDKHRYHDGVIFGHSKDGNVHFVISENFDNEANLNRFAAFHDELADLILSKDGNLKAEHGTGRALAPFVRRQYGDELYDVMVEIKRTVDPLNTMNPGVIISDDPEVHLRNTKSFPSVEPAISSCVECGYCENVCPSKDLTMTPRQRIVVRRARAEAEAAGDAAAVREIDAAYTYQAVQTCAADSLCVTACPVNIDTGKFMKSLRADAASSASKAAWKLAAKEWAPANRAASTALTGAYFLSTPLVTLVTNTARALVGDEAVPSYRPELPKGGKRRSALGGRVGSVYAAPSGVFVPACVNSMFGPAGSGAGASAAFARLVERAGLSLIVPDDIDSLCCGVPWSSKGLDASPLRARVLDSLRAASDGGRLPVVVDASSCTQGFRDMLADEGFTVLDAVEFVADHVLDSLPAARKVESLTLHPTCSTVHLGLLDPMTRVGYAAAESVTVPVNWSCCAYAGDRGMLHPELTASATKREAAEVKTLGSVAHASTNRTCELGMTAATGEDYEHVLEVLERATR